MKNIMLVDNSECVFESLKWVFKDEPYNLFAFKDLFEALKAIEEEEFAVVLADQSIPETDSLEFLEKVKEKTPDTAALLMCAFVEPETARDVLRSGHVFSFVKKPFDKEKITHAVEMAVDHYKINVASRLLRPLKPAPL